MFDGNRDVMKVMAIGCVAAALFSAGYASLHGDTARQLSVYLLPLIGLYVGFYVPHAIVVVNVVGIVLLLSTVDVVWRWPAFFQVVVLAATTVVPYIFDRRCRRSSLTSGKKNASQEDRLRELSLQVAEYENHRRSLEQEIDRINQLYVLGRELVEHTELNEVVDHMGRLLRGRPGIGMVAVFWWEQQKWVCVHCSPQEAGAPWEAYMKNQSHLGQERRFRILTPPPWLRDKAVVFWPVKIEKHLMASMILVTDMDLAPRYLEEGAIFVPQIALGLKRTRLFMEVKERARNDGLTGLYVRRYFLERLSAEILRSKRYQSQFAVCMIDIDYFKRVNDTFGHLMGDKVLCTLARIFVDCVRPGDLVGRYGGEEFVLLLPSITPQEAARIAEDVRTMVAKKNFSDGNNSFHVTVSIGVSSYPADGDNAETIIAAADKAMYWVKQHDRNGIKESPV